MVVGVSPSTATMSVVAAEAPAKVIGLQIVSMSTSGIQLSWLGVPSDLSGGVRSLEILSWGETNSLTTQAFVDRLVAGGWELSLRSLPFPRTGFHSLSIRRFPDSSSDVERAGIEEDGVPRIRFKGGHSVGKVQVGRGYHDFDEYTLSAIEVHAPSEHTLRKASWALEVQFWHEPLPLSRTHDLMQHTQQVLEDLGDTDSRFAALGRAEEMEKAERLLGKKHFRRSDARLPEGFGASGLAVGSGFTSSKQALDWVDADSKLPYTEKFLSAWLEFQCLAPLSSSVAAIVAGIFLAQAGYQGYEGSVPRPPCTPNVRWFIVGEPQPSAIEQLSVLLQETRLADAVHGNARQVQPFGPSRRHSEVSLGSEAFEAPPIPRQESLSPGRQKMILVERYCKVFVLCSVFLMCTPQLGVN
ncbi:unnamed protein product [Effrenium voratum]|nr:unnamed protein product [Effrenium voratum]